ncbi:MAG: radical SAM protein [Treponema sp.]
MFYDPYDYPLYRPPSEAYSIIVQVTLGCSYNHCAFCAMYSAKKFRIKPIETIRSELRQFAAEYRHVDKVFLADGDALTAPTDFLAAVLDAVAEFLPQTKRVSCYATYLNIRDKSPEELRLLASKGLKLLYLGVESGDDETLKFIKKGTTAKEIIELSHKVRDAGMELSATFILGINGKERDNTRHAAKTGEIISRMSLSYAGLLTLQLEEGSYLSKLAAEGKYTPVELEEIVKELKIILENVRPDQMRSPVIFRSNHASNFLMLRGTLPHDRDAMLTQVNAILEKGVYPTGRKYFL